MKKAVKILISFFILIISSFIITIYIKNSNSYPIGSDVYGHLFKINELYTSICDGNFYLIYSPKWYNSIEIFRYWPPASYYFYCIFMYITSGDIYLSFIIFIGVIFFIGAFSWFLFGIRENKIFFCTIIGLLWFFLPDNMRIFFSEGNIPRIFINALLPLLFFFINEFLYYKKKYALIPIYVLLLLIISSHIMISAMVGISIFIYLLIECIISKTLKNQLILLLNCILAYINSAIILIPGLTGGLLSQSSSASISTSNTWSQELYKSFNPFIRLENLDYFYFGFSLLIICLLGLFVLHKKTFSGFYTCFIIFLGTSTVAAQVISKFPLSQALWMSRFIPIAMVLFFISFIKWDELQKYIRYLLLLLIIIDSSLSLRFITSNQNYIEIQNSFEEKYLINDANKIVSNRLAIMDLSSFGSYPSYNIPLNNNSYLFGWAYQGAYNIKNIVNLNESFEKGYYLYMFDRLIEYGCDTVLIKKDEIKTDKENNLKYLDNCANKLGFEKFKENEYVILYKFPINNTFGTINTYENVSIGESANYICYLYPSFHELQNSYIDEYSFDDLKGYKNIYLSGFKYHNIKKAEELIDKLANNGVKIFIDMDNIPEDESLGKSHFLGVFSQLIIFTKEFPIIKKNNGQEFKLKLNTEKYSKWQTVYLTGLKNVIKDSEYSKNKFLNYIGTNDNDNIIFIGLNLVYYCAENNHVLLKSFLDEIFEINGDIIPKREIVDLKIEYDYNKIVISSKNDNVNTNISYLDCFSSDRKIKEENYQLSVNEGETIIDIHYSSFKEGLIISFISFIFTIIYWIIVFFRLKKRS